MNIKNSIVLCAQSEVREISEKGKSFNSCMPELVHACYLHVYGVFVHNEILITIDWVLVNI